ncbi:MAG: nucleotidyltransferase domain-containing protein [Bacteroidales bacterium]|nr:nucleotidyltransferase domain-containing protein [Bacteroidales bacterium]
MNLNKRKIQTINDYFRARPVLKAYLFGSYVRGDAGNLLFPVFGILYFKWN